MGTPARSPLPEEFWAALRDALVKGLRSKAAQLGIQPADLEDAVGEAIFEAWGNLIAHLNGCGIFTPLILAKSPEEVPGCVFMYIRKMVKNSLFDLLRHRQTRLGKAGSLEGDVPGGVDPVRLLEQREERRRAELAACSLSNPQELMVFSAAASLFDDLHAAPTNVGPLARDRIEDFTKLRLTSEHVSTSFAQAKTKVRKLVTEGPLLDADPAILKDVLLVSGAALGAMEQPIRELYLAFAQINGFLFKNRKADHHVQKLIEELASHRPPSEVLRDLQKGQRILSTALCEHGFRHVSKGVDDLPGVASA